MGSDSIREAAPNTTAAPASPTTETAMSSRTNIQPPYVLIVVTDGEPQSVWLMPPGVPIGESYRDFMRQASSSVASYVNGSVDDDSDPEYDEPLFLWEVIGSPGVEKGWEEMHYLFLTADASGMHSPYL